MKILVTGGAGFIGSNFVREILRSDPNDEVVVLDKLTYAGRLDTIEDLQTYERFQFVKGDICDSTVVLRAMQECDAVVHFAAESHVDRSIDDPTSFIDTAMKGTFVLLKAAQDLGVERFVQISTDEVYGSIDSGSFVEDSPLQPSSPYSASKAGADLLADAYRHTFGLETIICRSSNNYGGYQYPEKLIPLCILNALAGDPLPVYGDGKQVRNWLYVGDNCRAIDTVLREGKPGETYCIGGPQECENLEIVELILKHTGRDESLIEFVTDRPGHDLRYSLDATKVKALGWQPQVNLEEGLAQTVAWYRDNEWWWQPIRSGEYREYYAQQYGRELKGAGK